MCGIIGAFNYAEGKTKAEPVNAWVINQLEDQISRGKEGFGIIFINPDRTVKIERATEISKCLLDLYLNPAAGIILHHRQPTSSENKISQTHPILVSNQELECDYLVIHNGIIHNEDDMKIEHEKAGYNYTTLRQRQSVNTTVSEFNDSESIAIDFARFLEKKISKIKTVGSAALLALSIDKKTGKAQEVFYVRNVNPLHLARSRGFIRLASEGGGDPVKIDTLYCFNLDNWKTRSQKLEIPTYSAPPVTISTPSNYASGYENAWSRTTETHKDWTERLDEVKKKYQKQNEIGFKPGDDEEEAYQDELTKTLVESCSFESDSAETALNQFLDDLVDPDVLANLDDEYVELIATDIAKDMRDAFLNARAAYADYMDLQPEKTKKEIEISRKM